MPRVFLSPSQEDFNPTVLGVNEMQLMSIIADAMEPLLQVNGIEYQRVRPGAPVTEAINAANAGNFDVYLGIHSNASPIPGAAHGNRNYFWESSVNGRRLAQTIADEFAQIYYDPTRATIVPNREMEELRRTRMPAVMVFTAFHDNEKDARWIQTNIQAIAQALVRALAKYFDLTYVGPCMGNMTQGAAGHIFQGFRWAQVCTQEGALNVRSSPNGNVMFTLPRGTQVIVTGPERDGFTPIRFDFWSGWVASQFLCICCNRPATVRPPVIPPIFPPVMPVPPIGVIPPVIPPIGVFPPVTPEPPTISPPPPAPLLRVGRVHTHGANLNLRTEPSMEGRIIAQMPNNSHLLVLRDLGDWYYVFWNRHLGFAAKEWIQLDNHPVP